MPFSKFSVNNFPEIKIFINEYIDGYYTQNLRYTFYNYITNLIRTYSDNDNYSDSHSFNLLYKLDSSVFDCFYVERVMFNLQLCYYSIKNNNNNIEYIPNTYFKEWCDTWQKIFDNNTFRQKSIRKVIMPFQVKFLERLWDPKTDIGKAFVTKKMEELDWAEPDRKEIEN